MLSAPPAAFPKFELATYNGHLRRMCAAAGVQKIITSHSFRSGGASAAANAGVSMELVRDYGQWQSAETVAKHYVHYNRASLAAVTQAMAMSRTG